jgi:hypothetical protein
MRSGILAVALLALVACGSAGTAEQFRWTVDCPKSVERGAGFAFTVHATRPDGSDAEGVAYRYEILWGPSGGSPLKQGGTSGTAQNVHARMAAGPATLVVTGVDKSGRDVKVAEAAFEVR